MDEIRQASIDVLRYNSSGLSDEGMLHNTLSPSGIGGLEDFLLHWWGTPVSRAMGWKMGGLNDEFICTKVRKGYRVMRSQPTNPMIVSEIL
jgi:hypothetical protein